MINERENSEPGARQDFTPTEKPNPIRATEIWFRENWIEALKQKQISSTARLGDRSFGTEDSKGGYRKGDFVEFKLDKGQGQVESVGIRAVIKAVEIKKYGELEDADLFGSGTTLEQLQQDMSEYYGAVPPDAAVSIIRFEYKDNIKDAAGLIENGTLQRAKNPNDNPDSLNFPEYTLPLIENDYPARTAAMWNAAYKKIGIDQGNIMLVSGPENTGDILDVLRGDPKYLGGGAGVGFKEQALKHLDEIDNLAEAIGSVNFILKTADGKLRGYNTDGIGYAESLDRKFAAKKQELSGKTAVLLGAGGTGNSVAFALVSKGMRVSILNRDVSRAQRLAERINKYYETAIKNGSAYPVEFGGEEQIPEKVQSAEAIINVSRKGEAGELEQYSALAPAKLPATPENIEQNKRAALEVLKKIPKTAIISDVVLRKGEQTPLLTTAAEQGFETLDGVPMVVNQGVEAFWILYQNELTKKGVTKEQLAEIMSAAAA